MSEAQNCVALIEKLRDKLEALKSEARSDPNEIWAFDFKLRDVQKNVEFARFFRLPAQSSQPMEDR